MEQRDVTQQSRGLGGGGEGCIYARTYTHPTHPSIAHPPSHIQQQAAQQAPKTTMAPAIKLYYFDFGGRAEPIRLALHVGGVPFEDVRITEEEFRTHKAGAFVSVLTEQLDGWVCRGCAC